MINGFKIEISISQQDSILIHEFCYVIKIKIKHNLPA